MSALELDAAPEAWRPAPSHAHIPPRGAVHVWRACAENIDADDVDGLLSFDERKRADRFHFDCDRQQFIVAHAALRTILARYLAARPTELRFAQAARGKPFLVSPRAESFHFNLSHSGRFALIAVASHTVGVDLEHRRPLGDITSLAAQVLNTGELRAWQMLDQEQQPRALFNAWTRKEAIVKATGDGLACPLHDVEVVFEPGRQAELVWMSGTSTAEWRLEELTIGDDYAAAVACRRAGCNGDATPRTTRWIWEFPPLRDRPRPPQTLR